MKGLLAILLVLSGATLARAQTAQIILATAVLNLLAVFSTFGKSTAATAKTREHYEAKFLSEYPKVRFATGEGTLATALENVAKLSADRLPISVAPNRL